MELLKKLGVGTPESLKRLLVASFGVICLIVVNPLLAKAGLPPVSDTQIAAAASVLATFIIQSGLNSAMKRPEIKTLEEAKEVLEKKEG